MGVREGGGGGEGEERRREKERKGEERGSECKKISSRSLIFKSFLVLVISFP